MQMLVILGSPRKGGNSETLALTVAESFVQAGGRYEVVRLNALSLRPCQGCGGCDKTGKCIVKDDMQELYEKSDAADSILLVSPVYFYGLSAQCKIYGDRMQAKWARKYLLKERFRTEEGRKGYLVSTAATKGEKIFDCSVLTTRYIFDAMELEYGGDLLVRGVDEKKAVLEHAQQMAAAEQLGREIAAGLPD
jgi:multimeric flavodoxin WrbA